jgi:hypothetical protein
LTRAVTCARRHEVHDHLLCTKEMISANPINLVPRMKSTCAKYHCSNKKLLRGSPCTGYGTLTGYSARDSARVINVLTCYLSGNEFGETGATITVYYYLNGHLVTRTVQTNATQLFAGGKGVVLKGTTGCITLAHISKFNGWFEVL